jgi:hypothetical protein
MGSGGVQMGNKNVKALREKRYYLTCLLSEKASECSHSAKVQD